MIFYITIFVITLVIASKVKQGQDGINRICIAGISVILFAVSALRLNTGNDYIKYIEKFHHAFRNYYVVTEPGFNGIVKAVYNLLGKENYIAVFALFSLLTVVIFLIGMYKQSEDFKMTFFLFMAFGMYFQTFNTVRYYLALAIVLYSMQYIVSKKYIRFVVGILIATLFHKTAIIVIPFYILANINWKKWQLGLMGVFALSGLFLSKQYLAIMLKLYPSYVNEEEYLNAGGLSVVNIIRCVVVLAFVLINYKEAVKDNGKNQFYLYLNIGALALYTCFSFVPFLSRIGYYLNISQIFLIPSVLENISDKKKQNIWKLLIIIFGILYFAAFLYKADSPEIKILPYSTWINENMNFYSIYGEY